MLSIEEDGVIKREDETRSTAMAEKSVKLTSLYCTAQKAFENAEPFRHAHQLSSMLK